MRVFLALLLWMSATSAAGSVSVEYGPEFKFEHGLAIGLEPVLRVLKQSYFPHYQNPEDRFLFQFSSRDQLVSSIRRFLALGGAYLPKSAAGEASLATLSDYLDRWQPMPKTTHNEKGELDPELVGTAQRLNNDFADLLDQYAKWTQRVDEIHQTSFGKGFLLGMAVSFGIVSLKMDIPGEVPAEPFRMQKAALEGLRKVLTIALDDHFVVRATLRTYLAEAFETIREIEGFLQHKQLRAADLRMQRLAHTLHDDFKLYLENIYGAYKSALGCHVVFMGVVQ